MHAATARCARERRHAPQLAFARGGKGSTRLARPSPLVSPLLPHLPPLTSPPSALLSHRSPFTHAAHTFTRAARTYSPRPPPRVPHVLTTAATSFFVSCSSVSSSAPAFTLDSFLAAYRWACPCPAGCQMWWAAPAPLAAKYGGPAPACWLPNVVGCPCPAGCQSLRQAG